MLFYMNFLKYLALVGFLTTTQISCNSIKTANSSRLEEISKTENIDFSNIDYSDYIFDRYVKESGVYMQSDFVTKNKGKEFRKNPRTDYELLIIFNWDSKRKPNPNDYLKFTVEGGKGNLDTYLKVTNKIPYNEVDLNKKTKDPTMQINQQIISEAFKYYLEVIAYEQIKELVENKVERSKLDSIYNHN